MRSAVLAVTLGLLAAYTPLAALDLGTCDTTSITSVVETQDTAQMEDLLAQSASLLAASQSLVTLSAQMIASAENANSDYIAAMLRLSDDIGEMADRIGEMADRIVATELQIGIMADRILETQRIQSENLALTEANLLKAQENFNALLIQLSQ